MPEKFQITVKMFFKNFLHRIEFRFNLNYLRILGSKIYDECLTSVSKVILDTQFNIV